MSSNPTTDMSRPALMSASDRADITPIANVSFAHTTASGRGEACDIRAPRILPVSNSLAPSDSAANETLKSVSAATLSLIENGRTNPTVTLLWKIANAFKVSFTSLVEPPKPAVSVVRGSDMPVVEADGGRFRNHPLFSFDPAAQFEIYRIEMDPGAALGSEPHPAGTQEYLTIFSGEVEVTVEEASFRLSPGDAIRFPADCRHGYRAVGTEKVELSMVILYA